MTTLAQLTADIGVYTENNDALFLAQIPKFIRLAEKRIFTDAKLPSVRKTAAGVTVAGSRTLAIPADVLSIQSLSITDPATGEIVFLVPKAPDFLSEMYPVTASTGLPTYYARDGEMSVSMAPTPAAAYVTAIAYSGYPTSIVDSATGQTWIGDNYPQLLLYGCLVEAYVFMKGSKDLMEYYVGLYKAAIDELTKTAGQNMTENYR